MEPFAIAIDPRRSQEPATARDLEAYIGLVGQFHIPDAALKLANGFEQVRNEARKTVESRPWRMPGGGERTVREVVYERTAVEARAAELAVWVSGGWFAAEARLPLRFDAAALRARGRIDDARIAALLAAEHELPPPEVLAALDGLVPAGTNWGLTLQALLARDATLAGERSW